MMGDTLYGTLIGLTYGVTRALPPVLYCVPRALGGRTPVQASIAILSLKDRVHKVHGFALLLFGVGVLGYLYLGTSGLGEG